MKKIPRKIPSITIGRLWNDIDWQQVMQNRDKDKPLEWKLVVLFALDNFLWITLGIGFILARF